MTDLNSAQASGPIAVPRAGSGVKWLAVLVALIAALSFSPVLTNNFILVDDQTTVQNNPDFNPKTHDLGASQGSASDDAPMHLAHYWTGPTGQRYIPVTYTLWGLLSFIAKTYDARTGAYIGLNPAIYHAFSLLIHALNSVFVLLILQKVVARAWPAFFGAALFAVHPLQTEAVAWVSQTSVLLGAFFSLLAILEFMAFTDRRHQRAINEGSASPTGGWAHYAIGTLALVLAVLSHPSAVVAPVLVVIIELLRGRRWKALLGPVAVWVAIVAPIIVMTQVWQTGGFVVALQDRPRIAADALAFYLYKLLLPISLLPDYGRTPAFVVAQHGDLAYTWVVPIIAAAISLLFWKKSRWLAASFLLFAVAVAPGLGLNFLASERFSTTADRSVYLAMLGAALALACIVAREAKPMTFIAAGLLLTFLAALSVRQATFWSDTLRLYTREIDVHPDNRNAQELVARAYDDRAKDDMRAGNRPQVLADEASARDHFLIAARLPGDDGISFYNAAWCDVHVARYDVALQDVNTALNDAKFPLASAGYLLKGRLYEKQLAKLDTALAAENYNKALAAAKSPADRDAATQAQDELSMHKSFVTKVTSQPAGAGNDVKK